MLCLIVLAYQFAAVDSHQDWQYTRAAWQYCIYEKQLSSEEREARLRAIFGLTPLGVGERIKPNQTESNRGLTARAGVEGWARTGIG